MSVKDWKYDLSAYPWWDEKESILIKENSFADQKNDLLFVFHSLREPRMGMFMGHLAVFRDLSAPRLLFNIDAISLPVQTPFVSSDGNALFLVIDSWKKSPVVIVIDLQRKRFAYVRVQKYDHQFGIQEIDAPMFAIGTPDRLVDVQKLRWAFLNKIETRSDCVLQDEIVDAVERVTGPLRDVIKAEIAFGNRIVEVWENWPPESLAIMLGDPFKQKPKSLPSSIVYRDLNDTHYWKSEYYDSENKLLLACQFGNVNGDFRVQAPDAMTLHQKGDLYEIALSAVHARKALKDAGCRNVSNADENGLLHTFHFIPRKRWRTEQRIAPCAFSEWLIHCKHLKAYDVKLLFLYEPKRFYSHAVDDRTGWTLACYFKRYGSTLFCPTKYGKGIRFCERKWGEGKAIAPHFGDHTEHFKQTLLSVEFYMRACELSDCAEPFHLAYHILCGGDEDALDETVKRKIPDLPQPYRQIYIAAMLADVFGAPEIWENRIPDFAKGQLMLYTNEVLANELFEQIRLAVLYAVNEFI